MIPRLVVALATALGMYLLALLAWPFAVAFLVGIGLDGLTTLYGWGSVASLAAGLWGFLQAW